jgi:head-tail adaptor
MRAGRLRERVKVQRRSTSTAVPGVTEGPFEDIFDGLKFPANVVPTRRSDSVIAAKLKGINVYDVYLRSDSSSRTITADDRLVWVRPEGDVILNIRGNPVDPDGKRQELRFTCEEGVAT